MKQRKKLVLAAMLVASGLLSGCGTQMYELTEEEQQLIVSSAAYYVAKYNTFQKDGLMSVLPEEEEETPIETEEPDTQQDDEQSSEQGDGQGQTSGSQNEEQGMVSLADAVGYGNELSISYNGSSTMEEYKEGNHSVYSEEGNTLLVLKFTLQNNGSSPVAVSMLDKNCSFLCSYNGNTVPAEITFLLNYLSTYEGDIAAGGKVDTVLIFQIPKSKAGELGDLSLTISRNGVKKTVKL